MQARDLLVCGVTITTITNLLVLRHHSKSVLRFPSWPSDAVCKHLSEKHSWNICFTVWKEQLPTHTDVLNIRIILRSSPVQNFSIVADRTAGVSTVELSAYCWRVTYVFTLESGQGVRRSLTLICGITTKVLITNLLSRPQFFATNSLNLEMCIQWLQDSELLLASILRVSGSSSAGTLPFDSFTLTLSRQLWHRTCLLALVGLSESELASSREDCWTAAPLSLVSLKGSRP